jgi:hypothetical protein
MGRWDEVRVTVGGVQHLRQPDEHGVAVAAVGHPVGHRNAVPANKQRHHVIKSSSSRHQVHHQVISKSSSWAFQLGIAMRYVIVSLSGWKWELLVPARERDEMKTWCERGANETV